MSWRRLLDWLYAPSRAFAEKPGSKHLRVAITGNRPFLKYDFNTSATVRDALPNVVKRPGQVDIEILKYPRDTADTVEDINKVSKEVWTGPRSSFLPKPELESDAPADVTFVIHLGMDIRDEQMIGFETLARRDGYEKPDDDGVYVDSKHLKAIGLPDTLGTKFDVDAAWAKVKELYPDVPTRVSDDAGLYFCEYRLFTSLALPYLERSDKMGKALFMHIPMDRSEEAIALARDILVAYISALAEDKILKSGSRL